MNSNSRATGILVALAVTLLVVGCASGATVSPSPASAAPTPSPALATQRPSPAVAAPTSVPTPSPTLAATPTATSPTGQMTSGRSTQTATPLANGRVLVAGGFFNAVPVVSADLYDPQTSTFTATGPMATARGFDTATLLTDGRVLLAGGSRSNWLDKGPFFASAELYDPKTGTFTPTGSMTTGRNLHTATLLLDGRVLITGGNVGFDHSVASAELYDPQTGTFSPTGSMSTPRGFHTATLLDDGRVLIVGGGSAGWTPGHFLASAEIYDPNTDKFTPTGSMTTERALHTATLLADGRVLITGGMYNPDGSTSLTSAELFDPATGTFSATGSMADGRTFHTATLLTDGRVLVTAGVRNGWDYVNFLASAEIYDPVTGTFSPTGPMADRLCSQSATLLSDGRVLIAGGTNGSIDFASAELFDPTTGTFSPTGHGS